MASFGLSTFLLLREFDSHVVTWTRFTASIRGCHGNVCHGYCEESPSGLAPWFNKPNGRSAPTCPETAGGQVDVHRVKVLTLGPRTAQDVTDASRTPSPQF